MPIHKQGSGWQWGSSGKTYPTKEGAVKQAIAARSNGLKEVPHEYKMNAIRKASAIASKK